MTATNLLYSLFASSPSEAFAEGLRDEASRISTQENERIWTKSGLAQMARADSAIKETMRQTPAALMTQLMWMVSLSSMCSNGL